MDSLIISHEILNKMIEADNLTPYRQGFMLKRRAELVKPLTDLLIEKDPLLKNSFRVNSARHYPLKGVYLTIYIDCKECKDLSYKLYLNTKPSGDAVVEVCVEKIGDHHPDKHLTIKPDRIEGEARHELAKDVLALNKGSSKAYHLTQMGLSNYNTPSVDVIKKCVSEYMNKDMQTSSWIYNLLYTARVLHSTIVGKTLQGYVHDVSIHDHFSMTLCMEEQLCALHTIPVKNRILHMDATGRLVKIKDKEHSYGQILTYGIMAQNLEDIGGNLAKYLLVTVQEDQVIKIDKLIVQKKDLDSLENDNWLTDTIIEAYFTSLSKRYNVYVLSSSMAARICKDGTTLSVLRKNFLGYDFIAGPVNLYEKHWALLIVSIKTKQVVYIDPLGTLETEKKRVLSNWFTFCKSRTLKTISWQLLDLNHVIQSDTNSCGVLVSYFFKNIMEANLSALEFSFDTRAFRREMKETIMR